MVSARPDNTWTAKSFGGGLAAAVATYVLLAIVKKELPLDALLYTCLQILSVSVFVKTEISCALQADASQSDPLDAANQLNLFDF